MTCLLIGIGIATTLVGLVAHIIYWRIRRPADDVLALALFVGMIPLILSSIAYLHYFTVTATSAWLDLNQLLPLGALAIMHMIFALVYMSAYTAAQAASPTVLIVLLAQNDHAGTTKKDIEGHLTDDLVCGNLVQAAIHEKFVTEQNGNLVLGGRGRVLLILGRLARKLAGLSAPVG